MINRVFKMNVGYVKRTRDSVSKNIVRVARGSETCTVHSKVLR